MVPSSLPELMHVEDVEYLDNMMMHGATNGQAATVLNEEIEKSVNTKWRQFDNLIHTWVHEA
jgi:hypothetical protein